MRNSILLVAALVFAMISCGPQKEYKITGKVTGTDTGMVILQKMEEGELVNLDSTLLKDGKFTFRGKADMPELRYLTLRNREERIPFFIENARITIDFNIDSVVLSTVKGSAAQDVFDRFRKKQDSVAGMMTVLSAQYKEAETAGDSLGMARIDSLYAGAEVRQKEIILSYAKENGKSVVAPYLVMRNAYMFELNELEGVAASFDTSLQKSDYMLGLTNRIKILQKVQVGQTAPNFTMNDTLGNPFSLLSLKGKVVLVDFWASWCHPCRYENPNVVKAYNLYKAKGFDVLGVSMDRDREKWLEAVREDHLTWNHVSDLAGWQNAAGRLYGINSIPSNVLIDKDQVIVARNLRGEDLLKKLAEIFGPAGRK